MGMAAARTCRMERRGTARARRASIWSERAFRRGRTEDARCPRRDRARSERLLPPVPSVVDAAFAAAGHGDVEATGGWMGDKAKAMVKKAKEGSKKALRKTKEAAEAAAEKAKDGAEAAVEMAKDGTEVVAEGSKKVAKGAASKTKSAGKALVRKATTGSDY